MVSGDYDVLAEPGYILVDSVVVLAKPHPEPAAFLGEIQII